MLKIFDFKGLPSDSSLLSGPFTVIISDDAASDIFTGLDAVGKKLEFKDENGKKYAFQVTGVFKNGKEQSFNPDFFKSLQYP